MVDAERYRHPAELLRAHAVAAAWILLGLGAAVVRLVVLDRQPLSETEARLAVAAWQSFLGRWDASLVESGSPLLAYATVAVFGLFGASDVAARLVPALTGVGLVMSPALLTGALGLRTTLWAGVLIAVSPLAIYASRVLDPAILAAALAMLTVASAVRLATDRPWWAKWTLALGAGLSVAAGAGAVLAGAAALVAAAVLFVRPREGAPSGWRGALSAIHVDVHSSARDLVGPAILFGGVALLFASGGLMDLRGVGFVLADTWGQAPGLLAPDAFPTRNLASILGYAWPLLALAILGYVLVARGNRPPRPGERARGRRAAASELETTESEEILSARRLRNRVVSLLALWALILVVVAAVGGRDQLSLVVLPMAPLALLAGTALARLSLDPRDYELSGEGWATLGVAAILVAAALVIFSQNVASNRPVAIVAWVALIGLLVLLATGWRSIGAPERLVIATVVAVGLLSVATISAISRASFGGSPVGTELLARDETASAFRTMFRELTILATVDPARSLVVELPEPFAARWYGRAITPGSGEQHAAGRAYVLREAPQGGGAGPSEVRRAPWKVTSEIEPADVYPLGILRWLVSRSTLVHGRPHDIIVAR